MKKTDDLYSLQNPAWPLHCASSNTHSSAESCLQVPTKVTANLPEKEVPEQCYHTGPEEYSMQV